MQQLSPEQPELPDDELDLAGPWSLELDEQKMGMVTWSHTIVFIMLLQALLQSVHMLSHLEQ